MCKSDFTIFLAREHEISLEFQVLGEKKTRKTCNFTFTIVSGKNEIKWRETMITQFFLQKKPDELHCHSVKM